MTIVGLVSCYKEGQLAEGAIRSLERAEMDAIYVCEGPAGEPLGDDVPDTTFPFSPLDRFDFWQGRWRTDARKRNAMLERAKKLNPGRPLWGVWLDGDEVLRDGEFLRDQLQSVFWEDEQAIRWPLWVVEADGSVALTTGRVVRLDLIRSYDISVSVVTNELGLEEGQGNENPDARLWIEMWQRAMSTGRMLSLPPHPGQPHIVHRSNLRHPLRKGLRMHKQEADELRKAGKL